MSDDSTLKHPRYCTFEGCERKHYGKGLCRGHYQQSKRGVGLNPLKPPFRPSVPKPMQTCSFEACDKPVRYSGLCSGHNNQRIRGQELRPLRARRANGAEEKCRFDGCPNITTGGAFGLCRGHYRQCRLGQELRPLPNRNDNLGRDERGRKTCAKCRDALSVDLFHSDASRPDGLQTRCRMCVRSVMLATTYGITTEQYDELLAGQSGVCAICGVTESGDGSSLAVDHDHACCPGRKSCGECIRGLLCRSCNQGLGNFRDRPDFMRAAAAYIEKS